MKKQLTDLTRLGLLNLKNEIIKDLVFYIPSYQRGYRWQSEMVTTLLKDIIDCKDELYCIQPIVVKKKQDTEQTYIVADGQQRLTTLFVIYSALGIELPFKFQYETRDRLTGDYLNNKRFKESDKSQSVDCYFIANSYEIVRNYADNEALKQNLDKVHFIWYPLAEGNDEDAQIYFDRLNFGKIKLEDAELVKALFLLDHSNDRHVISEGYQNQIALEWDLIERKLQDPKFWGFINTIKAIKEDAYPVRIGLILDLYTKNTNKDKQEYETFLQIEKELNDDKNTSIKTIWEKINQIFETLCEWYEDDYLFHYVGFLMSQRNLQTNYLTTLLKEWGNSESRDKFKSELINKVRKIYTERSETEKILHIADDTFVTAYIHNIEKETTDKSKFKDLFEDRYSLSDLVYGSDNYLIQDILLLFNILEMKPKDEKEKVWKGRFRFDLYKQDRDKKQIWSLEHICAQNESAADEEEAIHTLDNMALLTVDDNASNSDDSFHKKKDNIRALDMQGSFIPQATKNVFLKYYTLSNSLETNDSQRWTEEDRKHYFLHLILTLNKFAK